MEKDKLPLNHDTIVAWVLSALAYTDRKKMHETITHFFPTFRTDFKATKNGSLVYGLVIDDKNGKCYLVKRGTGGDNFIGKLASWYNNFMMSTSGNGTHDGFEKEGNQIVDELKHYFGHFDEVNSMGHSKGSGITIYDGPVILENFPHIKHVQADAFATPPVFDEIGKVRVDKHIASGRLFLTRWNLPGDPITSKLLRSKALGGGVDVGRSEVLQNLIRYDMLFWDVVKHSAMLYNAALLILLAKIEHLVDKNDWDIDADQQMLGELGDFIVN